MPMGRPKAELVLSEVERAQLSTMARSRSLPAALVSRVLIVLAATAGEPNKRYRCANAGHARYRV